MTEPSLDRADEISAPAPIKQLSCLAALREQRGDVCCFTPALLVAFARIPVDPAQDFIHRFPSAPNLRPFCVELPPSSPPFFSGIPITMLAGRPVDWNRRLYAIAAERAKECFDFLSGIGVSDNKNFFASSVMYNTVIPDPLSRDSIRATIDVTIFGVFSGNNITYLAPTFNTTPFVKTISAENAGITLQNFKVDTAIENQFKQLRADTEE